MIPELLPTALAFYRAPGQYPQLRDARVPLPAGVTDLLTAHAHALAPEQIEDTAARLDSNPEECRNAVTFFIRQALLEARGGHYRTLGVSRDADSTLIQKHYHYLIRLFHPDRDLDREGWETLYAPAINEAWNQLRTPAKRSQYDAGLPNPDAFDALLAQGRDAKGGAGLSARAPTPGNRNPAGMVVGVFASLSPRIVLGVVFGLPLAMVLLWLLAKPAPQELRISAPEPAVVASPAMDNTAAGSATAAGTPAASMPSSTSDTQGSAATPVDTAETRGAPRRATSVEQQVRERLASATNAVLEPSADANSRRQLASRSAPARAAAVAAIPAEVTVVEIEATSVVNLTQLEPAFDSVSSNLPVPDRETGETQSPPPAAPILAALDGAQLGAVVAAFTSRYEAGDARHFSALFAENADTSDAKGREEIRSLYQDFFARPETREIHFGRMLWEYRSPFRSRGTGPVRVTTVPLNGSQPASGELMITLEVEQTVAGPVIVALYYQ